MKNEEDLIGNSRNLVDFLGNSYNYNCLGCEITNKKITPPGGIIYEDDAFILAIDPDIPLNGFLIITAKRHINSITELSKDEQHKLVELINKSVFVLKELNVTKKVSILQEESSKHFHVWIFPIHEWMVEKFGKGISYSRDICEYLKETATDEDIKEILKTIDEIKSYFR